MRRREFLTLAASFGLVGATGCGTLLHSERIGQPHSHCIDWKVAALDGLGLLLFFIPGVIAFVVDFSNGTIYLPECEVSSTTSGAQLRRIEVSRDDLNATRLEAIVRQETGHAAPLFGEETRVSEVATIDDFTAQRDQHAADRRFGSRAVDFFRRLRTKRRG